MLWDCGHSETNKPSQFLPCMGVRRIDHLFVTNYDQDHISDLPQLRRNVDIRTLHRNRTISVDELVELKEETGPISNAMNEMIDMHGSFIYPETTPPPAFPDVSYKTFWNRYYIDFEDTNNLSLVTFLRCRNTTFLIPGDIEYEGWNQLLKNPNFRSQLRMVDVFIASHHGRESGFNESVFDYCRPDVFVFSDGNIQYATQDISGVYGAFADGIRFNDQTRYVLSTRKDGELYWNL